MNTLVDQASHLRSLVRQTRATRPRRATVIAITSGKGGVGKSNLAVNLAISLSAAGKSVVLLDADLGLANADVLCNVDVPTNLSHVIARKKDLSEVMVGAPGGFRLVAGASGLARMADLPEHDRQRLVDSLAELEEQADVILIDTGAGISPNVLTFTQAADHVVVVTTPEPTAITDAYAVVKVISRRDAREARGDARGTHRDARGSRDDARGSRDDARGSRDDGRGFWDASAAAAAEPPARRISLVVNQTRTPAEARQVYDRIAKVARQFLGTEVADGGFVATDDAVPAAVRRRSPFVLAAPRSEAAQCVHRVAARLGESMTQAEGGGFFNRMSKWFRR